MLSLNPTNRPTISEILNSQVVKQFLKDYWLENLIPFNYNPFDVKKNQFNDEEEKNFPKESMKKPIKSQSDKIKAKFQESDNKGDFENDDSIQMTPSNNLNIKKYVENHFFIENEAKKGINPPSFFGDFPSNMSSSLGLEKKEFKTENEIKKNDSNPTINIQSASINDFDDFIIPEERGKEEKDIKLSVNLNRSKN